MILYMKVKELIEQLGKLDPESEIEIVQNPPSYGFLVKGPGDESE